MPRKSVPFFFWRMSIDNSNRSRDCQLLISSHMHVYRQLEMHHKPLTCCRYTVQVPAISGKLLVTCCRVSNCRCFVPQLAFFCRAWACTVHPECSRTITVAIGDRGRGHGTLKKPRSQGKRNEGSQHAPVRLRNRAAAAPGQSSTTRSTRRPAGRHTATPEHDAGTSIPNASDLTRRPGDGARNRGRLGGRCASARESVMGLVV